MIKLIIKILAWIVCLDVIVLLTSFFNYMLRDIETYIEPFMSLKMENTTGVLSSMGLVLIIPLVILMIIENDGI